MVSSLFSPALLALLLISSVNGFILESEENEALQGTCGTNMKEVDGYARKVLNGVAAHSNEAPWTVALYLPNHKDDTVYTTGTLISNRHIISYDRLFLTNTTDGIMFRHNMESIPTILCQKRSVDMILPRSLARKVSVFSGLLKADRFSGKKELQVSSVRILKGCVTPHEMNRLVIIELKKPVELGQTTRPICVGSDVRPNAPFTFYGYGDNRGEVMDATLRHTEVTEVPCVTPSDDLFCVKAKEPLCNGDFGGAAIKKVSGAIRAYGVYVDGPYECAKANEDTVYTFANVTRLAEDICDQTGVCATYLPELTTVEPYPATEYPRQTPPIRDEITTLLPEYERTTTGDDDGDETVDTTDQTIYITALGATTTESPEQYTTTTSIDNGGRENCVPDTDDDDIYIHIKLGKYIKTGNEMDIEITRQGPRKLQKRNI